MTEKKYSEKDIEALKIKWLRVFMDTQLEINECFNQKARALLESMCNDKLREFTEEK